MTTAEETGAFLSSTGLKRLLFGEDSASKTVVDVLIVVLLMAFLFNAPISIAAMNISYGLAMLLWLGRMVIRGRNEVQRTALDWFLIAFVIAELLSLSVSYNKEQSMLFIYRRITLLPIIYIIVSNARTHESLRALFVALIGAMVVVSVFGVVSVLAHLHEFLLFQRRLVEFQMYMTAGGMMMMGMILLLPFAIHPGTPRTIRWLSIAAMAPLAVNLLFTFTRSSWLGFLAGAVVIAAMKTKKLLIPLAILVVIVVAFATPEMRDRMSSIINPYHPANIGRLRMWGVGIEMFRDHPILGVGDIDLGELWKSYADPQWEASGHLHNNLIMWLVTLGIVGFSALVALFVKIWLVAYRTVKKLGSDWFLGSLSLGVLALLASFHVNGLFEWNFGDAEIIMVVWALVGMIIAAANIGVEGKPVG